MKRTKSMTDSPLRDRSGRTWEEFLGDQWKSLLDERRRNTDVPKHEAPAPLAHMTDGEWDLFVKASAG